MRSKDLDFIDKPEFESRSFEENHSRATLEARLVKLDRMRLRRTRLSNEQLVSKNDIEDLDRQFDFKMSDRYPLSMYTQLPSPTNVRPTLEEFSKAIDTTASKTSEDLMNAIHETLSLHLETIGGLAEAHSSMFKVQTYFRETYQKQKEAGIFPEEKEGNYSKHYCEIYNDILTDESLLKTVTSVTSVLVGIYALIASYVTNPGDDQLDTQYAELHAKVQLIVGGDAAPMYILANRFCDRLEQSCVNFPSESIKTCREACEILTSQNKASAAPIMLIDQSIVSVAMEAVERYLETGSTHLFVQNGQGTLAFDRLRSLSESAGFLFSAQMIYTRHCWMLFRDLIEHMQTR